jgi:protein-tyrosine sulfotransferase
VGIERALKELLTRHRWLNVAYGVLQHGPKSLARRCPASLGPGEIAPPPFFIIGAARSGNTLLRALLVGHSEISIPPESYVLGGIIRQWDRHNFRDWNELVDSVIGEFESHPEFSTWEIDLAPVRDNLHVFNPNQRSLAKIVDAIYRHYSAVKFPGFRMWGDKTPLNTERIILIDRVFPAARHIHMLRDGRDAVSSAVKAGMFDGSVEGACRSWQLRTRNALQLGRRIGVGRYLELRYEDLVSGPRDAVVRVCDFLGVDFEEQMMAHDRAFGNMGDTQTLDHHAQVGQAVTTDSVGKWRERLTDAQAHTVERILHKDLSRLGYG